MAMETNQKYTPDFGYIPPVRTRNECPNPAFTSRKLHRCGYFKQRYDSDGLPGWSCIAKCVNCGRDFPKLGVFVPDKEMAQ